jgi:hypothetical protein
MRPMRLYGRRGGRLVRCIARGSKRRPAGQGASRTVLVPTWDPPPARGRPSTRQGPQISGCYAKHGGRSKALNSHDHRRSYIQCKRAARVRSARLRSAPDGIDPLGPGRNPTEEGWVTESNRVTSLEGARPVPVVRPDATPISQVRPNGDGPLLTWEPVRRRCHGHVEGTAGEDEHGSGLPLLGTSSGDARGSSRPTTCLVGKPRRRCGRRVRTCVALAAGCGRRGRDGHRYGSPTHCRACPTRRAHNICPRNCSSAGSSGNQNISNIDDLLLRKRSYATCRCCMNLFLQVRAM